MPTFQKKVGQTNSAPVLNTIAIWSSSSDITDSNVNIFDLLGRNGGIKIVPVGITETIGANFENFVTKKQTIEGTLTVLGQNTIL